jgi:hypothetical protein
MQTSVDTSKLKASSFTHLILQLNRLLDSGKYERITIEEVHKHIDDRSVLRWLADIAEGDIDLSVYLTANVYGEFEELYANFLQNLSGGYAGREYRKWGVENRGICLLIAWTNEIIQCGDGWQPDKDMFRVP